MYRSLSKYFLSKESFLLIFILFIAGFNCKTHAFSNADSVQYEALHRKISQLISMNYPEALRIGKEALVIARKSGSPDFIARANSQLGYLYWIDGYYYRSIAHLDTAYTYFMDLEDKNSASSTRNTKGLNFYYMAMYDSAIYYHREALELYRSIGKEELAGKVISHISLVYHKMGKYSQSVNYMLEANRIRTQYSEQASAYNFKNSNPAFRNSTYYQEELNFHLKTLNQADRDDDPLKIADAKLNIGLSYYFLEDYENALKYFNESNLLYSELGRVAYWNESAKTLNKLGRYKEGLELLASHEKTIKEKGTRITLAEIYLLMGDIYFNMGDYKNAIHYHEKHSELARQMNNRLSLAECMEKAGECYMMLGDYQTAGRYIKESLHLAQAIGAIGLEKSAYGVLSAIESESGNYKEAYKYQLAYSDLVNRINEGEASVNMVNAQAGYEAFQKSEEINELKIQSVKQKARVENMKLVAISIFVFTISILLLAVILFLRNKLKTKTNQFLGKKNKEISQQKTLLEDQNKKIELLLGEIHHRVKNNLQVINSLLSLQALRLKDKNAKLAVIEGQNRVQVMGLIHENLYQSNQFGSVNMNEYLHNLSGNLISSFGFTKAPRIEVETNAIQLDVDTSVSVGLIANELVTNSLKYAFENVDLPVLKIKLELVDERLILEVLDNGCGMENIDTSLSYGLTLVKELAKRMDGEMIINCDEWTKVCIIMKKFKVAA